jgi:hypothetical protein
MQRLLDAMTREYWRHTAGLVAAERVLPMIEKFCERYHVGDSKDQRYRRRQWGGGNAALLLAPADRPGTLQWFLLVSGGEHLAHQLETLQDARAKTGRILLDGFELLELSRPSAKGGGVRWTWRMTEETMERWRIGLRTTARSSAVRINMPPLLQQLFAVPGFGGIRQQVGHLTRYARGELARANVPDAENMFPRTLRYVRRLKTEGVPLKRWCREALHTSQEMQSAE